MEIPHLSANYDSVNGGMVEFGDDRQTFHQFYTRAVLNQAKSKEESRPVYDNVPYVKIQHRGEKDFLDRPVQDNDTRRFRESWKLYVEGREATVDGTPLSVLFPADPAVCEMLNRERIYTVEQLGELPDTALQNLGMGARDWQNNAKKFLATATGGKEFQALELESQRQSEEIAALKSQIEQIVNAQPEKRGPGRPSNEELARRASAEG